MTPFPSSRLYGWDDFEIPYVFGFPIVRAMAQEAFVVPLTILAALERGVLRYATRTELCIHVVGASYRETTGNGDLEELLHHLPRLRKLVICFVGPEVFDNSGEGNTACDICRAKGRRRTYVYFVGPYQDFACSDVGQPNHPDLVIGFNTGTTEIDAGSWSVEIRAILDSGALAAFTEYT